MTLPKWPCCVQSCGMTTLIGTCCPLLFSTMLSNSYQILCLSVTDGAVEGSGRVSHQSKNKMPEYIFKVTSDENGKTSVDVWLRSWSTSSRSALQDLWRRYEQESHGLLQHDSVRVNNHRKDNNYQMWQTTKSSKNIGNSWKKDTDPTWHDVPREPRKSVKWKENNRRKEHWSRNIDWTVLENNRRDGKKSRWKWPRQKRI